MPAIGIAGGPEKCRIVTEEYWFDAAVGYRIANVRRELREKCPDGIDVFFDNVGGDVLEAALGNLAEARGLCSVARFRSTTRARCEARATTWPS